MKKVYDWDIRVRVQLPDYKRSFTLVLAIHSNAHQVCMKAAQLLGYDEFASTLQLYCPDQRHPVNPIQTLFQHGVRDGDTLTVKLIHAIKSKPKFQNFVKNKLAGTVFSQQSLGESALKASGLVVQGFCKNIKCCNYGQQVQLPMGHGEFNFFHLSSKLKCPSCPNRDQFWNPSLEVSSIQVVNCVWKFQGFYKGNAGIVLEHKPLQWQRAAGDGSVNFIAKLKQRNWVQLKILVKLL